MVIELGDIFNNRELAVVGWITVVFIISIFTKIGRDLYKSILSKLFFSQLMIFVFVFIVYLIFMVHMLSTLGLWSLYLLKDTIFWILLVELPIFIKTIKRAKNNHFFSELMRENISVIVFFTFFLNFWTFSLIAEILIVPISFILSIMYTFAKTNKSYKNIVRYINGIWICFGIAVMVNAGVHFLDKPSIFLNMQVLKIFLLPVLLFVCNLPIVYVLALYCKYEEVFVRISGNNKERRKSQISIILFAGISLNKISAVYDILPKIIFSLTNEDIKIELNRLEEKLVFQVGDNYMKRVNFYIFWSIIFLLLSIIGIVTLNFKIAVGDMIKIEFVGNFRQIKDIITYICSTGIVGSLYMLIYSIGMKKQKNEEISQVKKYALYDFFYLLNIQSSMIKDIPYFEDPIDLFERYIKTGYALKIESEKSMAKFENLLSSWELDILKQLKFTTDEIIMSIGINEEEINKYTSKTFREYFFEKKANACQNEKINVFIYDVEKAINKYVEQIKICSKEFKNYM